MRSVKQGRREAPTGGVAKLTAAGQDNFRAVHPQDWAGILIHRV